MESRALIYQGILITTEVENKLLLINALKTHLKIMEWIMHLMWSLDHF